jgi:hypothetical protein
MRRVRVMRLVPRHATGCTPARQWVALACDRVRMLTGEVRMTSVGVRFSWPSYRFLDSRWLVDRSQRRFTCHVVSAALSFGNAMPHSGWRFARGANASSHHRVASPQRNVASIGSIARWRVGSAFGVFLVPSRCGVREHFALHGDLPIRDHSDSANAQAIFLAP